MNIDSMILAEELSEQKSDSRQGEEGFRGTLLMSDASPFTQVVC